MYGPFTRDYKIFLKIAFFPSQARGTNKTGRKLLLKYISRKLSALFKNSHSSSFYSQF